MLGIPLLLAGGFLGAWWFDTRDDDGLVARGVSLSGTQLGGVSTEVAGQAVADLAARFNTIPVEVEGPDDLRMQTTADRLGLILDEQATLDLVLSSSQGSDPISWVRSFGRTDEVDAVVRLDPDRGEVIIDEIASLVASEPGAPSMTLENDRLVGIAGQPGKQLDRPKLLNSLSAELPDTSTESIRLTAPLSDVPSAIAPTALQTFVDELNGNTLSPMRMSAGGTTRSFEPAELRSWLRLEVDGEDLIPRIDDDLVQAAVTERFGDVATLPDFSFLTIVDDKPTLGDGAPDRCCDVVGPDVLAAILARESKLDLPMIDGSDKALEEIGIVELVGEFTTDHPAGQSRVINIQRMADLVRGAVLAPGEEFSINDHVGRRTREKGFVEAGVINYGVLDLDVGGGVSQFATTMFNAAFFGGFDILDYQMHSIYFTRYPYGREATLSFPQIDLRIRNPSRHHALIWTEYTDTSITVKLYSTTFAQVEDLGTSTSASGQCSRATTTRQRVFLDGTEDADEFSALYQPAEGLDCSGNSTLPQPDCSAGQVPVDTNRDGRNDSCGPAAATCGAGETGLDSNGDGFIDLCQTISVNCPANSFPVDTTGDGVGDSCQASTPQPVTCGAGSTPVDTNGDGVADACQTTAPQPVSCAAGSTPADTNGDGVADTCQIQTSTCPDGYTLSADAQGTLWCVPNQ